MTIDTHQDLLYLNTWTSFISMFYGKIKKFRWNQRPESFFQLSVLLYLLLSKMPSQMSEMNIQRVPGFHGVVYIACDHTRWSSLKEQLLSCDNHAIMCDFIIPFGLNDFVFLNWIQNMQPICWGCPSWAPHAALSLGPQSLPLSALVSTSLQSPS